MVELKVGTDSLSLYPNEVVSLVMSINDLASIENADGNYSNKFTIPATSGNNSILGYPSEINFVTGFKPTKSRGASILIDGLEVQRGFIQIEQYNALSNEFSISFMGGNVDWFDLIADKKLADINLSNYNHVWNANTVVNSFTNTSGYIYPFINYGRYRTRTDNQTNINNWLPAIFSHTLIKQIFNDVNWKVGGTLFNDPIFLKHILPFSIKDLNIAKGSIDELGASYDRPEGFFAANAPIIYPFKVDYNELENYNPITGVYTANEDMSLNVYAEFNYNGTGTDRLQIRVNGVMVYESPTNSVEGALALNSGDVVTITTNNGGFAPPVFFTGRVVYTPSTSLTDGMGIPMTATMPDITQEDFIKTIFNQFGAVFTSDNLTRTVYINKFTDIKKNIHNALDWTSKIDNGKDIEIDYTELLSNYNKVNKYGYKENKDNDLANQVSAEEVVPFAGDGSFTIDNDFLSKEGEVFTSEFVSSSQVESFNGRIKQMYIPRYKGGTTGGKGNNNPLPRCAIVASGVSVSELFATKETSINVTGSSVGTVNSTTIPFAYFDSTFTGVPDIDTINQSLSFGNNIIPKAHKNLLETYYEDYISILNNPRRITLYLLLNERDINNLNFMMPIYLGGKLNSYFFLNKISDYRPMSGGVTKVELVLIA